MNAANTLGAQIGVGSCGAVGGVGIGGVQASRELGILERGAGLVSSLRNLNTKLADFRDRIEGAGACKAGSSPATPSGFSSQITEAETILRACHALLDDIAGKF